MRVDILKEEVKPIEKVKESKTETKPTIHIIHILDGSGSMRGAKFQSALEGMQEEVNTLKKQNDVNYTYSVIEFDSNTRIKTVYKKASLEEFDINSRNFFKPSDCTALYDAIGVTLYNFDAGSDDRVLVKIFTDGGENDSVKYDSKSVRELIEAKEALGWTITFVGTHNDVNRVIQNIRIKKGNTLGYDGTARGLTTAYTQSIQATVMYSKAVVDGTDDNTSFFTSK